MSDVDVAIIGAGAAGLSAAKTVQATGRSFVVLEAMDRAGGRAFTTTLAGMPYDAGCHWLHSASRNPFTTIADRLGFRYLNRGGRDAHWMHLGERWADDATVAAAWADIETAFEAAEAPGLRGEDVAALTDINIIGPWYRLARHWLTLLSAAPPEEISSLDLSRYHDTGENFPVEEGYGALVAANAADIPVWLNHAVERVVVDGDAVTLSGGWGTVRARAALLTASTNVLATGRIAFEPVLPERTMTALAHCPTGAAEKAIIVFDRDVFGAPPTSYFDFCDMRDPQRPPINFTLNPFGRPMAIGQLAGALADDLVDTPDAMAAFALDALADAFGADIRARVVATGATAWRSMPSIQGAYSCALPGYAWAREALAAPVHKRLFLAGEAVSPHAFSTCHGAHESGAAQAKRALALL